jgi:hypothetical protein
MGVKIPIPVKIIGEAMFFLQDVILALLLLTGTSDLEKNNLTLSKQTVTTIRLVATQLELLDRNEAYLLSRPDSYGCDINVLRGRYHELKDAPLVSDSKRFPPVKEICELLEFNAKFRYSVEEGGYTQLDWMEVLTEATRLRNIWENAREARTEGYYIVSRRRALLQLRIAIGEEAYYSGKLPPVVPLWRFKEY